LFVHAFQLHQSFPTRRSSDLSDGTVLRANVFSPVTDDDVPVLLLRHPYSKDNPFTMSHMQVMPVVRAGYIVAIVDVRGRFASEGDRKSTRLNSSHVKISYAVF